MCGIAGFFVCGTDPAAHEQIIGEMLSAIVHRGPDEIGCYPGDDAPSVASV
jgi:asparagine synthetase B (glutamine-hydrolysing)